MADRYAPKPPAKRQRRNHVDIREIEVPTGLVPHPAKKNWDKRTKAHWRKIWSSPLAREYIDVDVEGLYILMDLVEEYWKQGSGEVRGKATLEGSINRQRQEFGLSPLSRRRLQWEIKRVEAEKPAQRPSQPKNGAEPVDPRRLLSAV